MEPQNQVAFPRVGGSPSQKGSETVEIGAFQVYISSQAKTVEFCVTTQDGNS